MNPHRIWIGAVLIMLSLSVSHVSAQPASGELSERAVVAKAELQAALDRAESTMGSADGVAVKAPHPNCECVGATASSSTAKIEEALRGPLHSTGLDFVEQPLEEVVALLEDDYGISVELDLMALEEAALGPAEPVSINIHNTSLESALRLMLTQLELTYLIKHEVLLITTLEAANREMNVCVYDIRDLVDAKQPKAVHALVDAIVSCASGERWTTHGGSGEIRPVPPNLLVISQTQGMHEEIRELLAAIRKTRQRLAAAGEPAEEPLREPTPADESPTEF
jgi:hypothetical protein